MAETTNLNKTSLYDCHARLGARFVPFAGWEMPVQYSGLVEEHRTVRTGVGLFDVSHMGELTVTGRGALSFLQYMTVNDVSKLQIGQAQYNAFCYPSGTIVDDIIVYRLGTDNFFLCVNASNVEKDFQWLLEHVPAQGVKLENKSSQYAQIAVQGPQSRTLLGRVADVKIEKIPYYYFTEGKVLGVPAIIARTGYTGELGFEIYCPTQAAPIIWNGLLDMGADLNPKPCGLGARDTLRLEAGYLLYGNDMDQDTTALECGLSWIVRFEKEDFIGKDALLQQKSQGLSKKLVGLCMNDKAIARPGYRVCNADGTTIGRITSGSPAPWLGKNIALAYLDNPYTKLDTPVFVDVRGSAKPASVVPKSFYTQGSASSV